mmetsp:Transcript_22717/g.61556  ORF Transcript_22717/g.61556 Transcript_22717/m.61556 type:complete len:218 (+) Transcript_22717:197-850(+)
MWALHDTSVCPRRGITHRPSSSLRRAQDAQRHGACACDSGRRPEAWLICRALRRERPHAVPGNIARGHCRSGRGRTIPPGRRTAPSRFASTRRLTRAPRGSWSSPGSGARGCAWSSISTIKLRFSSNVTRDVPRAAMGSSSPDAPRSSQVTPTFRRVTSSAQPVTTKATPCPSTADERMKRSASRTPRKGAKFLSVHRTSSARQARARGTSPASHAS